MVSEPGTQSMAWMETDYSEHAHFRWKVKWWLEHLGALGIMGEAALLTNVSYLGGSQTPIIPQPFWRVALKLGRIANFDVLFLVRGFNRLISVLHGYCLATICVCRICCKAMTEFWRPPFNFVLSLPSSILNSLLLGFSLFTMRSS